MMATAEMSSNSHSPRSPNPPCRTTAGLSSPWAQVVVRGVSEPPVVVDSVSPVHEPASSSLSTGDGSDKPTGGNVGPKTAWNKPSNVVSLSVTVGGGGEESVSDQSSGSASGSGAAGTPAVMGVSAWPALSESTRHSLKSSSIDSSPPKPASEGNIPVSQGPLALDLQEQSKQSSASANTARHRPVKRGGGNRQGGFSRGASTPPMPPVFPVPEMAQSGFSHMVPRTINLASREASPIGAFVSNSQSLGDHSHRGSNHRGGFGHGRNNYRGNRRDQYHGNHDWVSSQIPHIRDAHGHPHMPLCRGFMRPHAQGAPPFAFSPVLRPFGNAMVYPGKFDMPHLLYYPLPPNSFGGMPYFPSPPSSSYFVMSDSSLHISIVKQIDYYFSDANLVKDKYLRSKMDDDGWVPISLISSFPKVQSLTDNIPYILWCLGKYSSVVEVQGDKVRRRGEWTKWIANLESQVGSSLDKLTTNLQKFSLT